MKRTPLKSKSAKRRKEERLYVKLREDFLAGSWCKRCGTTSNLEVQHLKGRIGELYLDTRFWMALCSTCHQHVTVHRTEAIAQGYALSRLAVD